MKRVFGLTLAITLLASSATMAFQYYLSGNDLYWILQDDSVGYQVWVPADAYRYVQTDRFGERMVEISLTENGPVLTVGGIKQTGLSVNTVRQALVNYWNRILSDVQVDNNSQITTSNGIAATFYSITGTSPTGQSVMVRVILYQRGKDIVYITYTLPANQYTGDIREYWIRAVNTFKWL